MSDLQRNETIKMINPKRYVPTSRPSGAKPIEYGGTHPFELYELHEQRRRLQSSSISSHLRRETELNAKFSYYKRPQDLIDYQSIDHLFEPIRIYFETSALEEHLENARLSQDVVLFTKISLLLQQVLPELSKIWKDTLKVIPVQGGIYPIDSSLSDQDKFQDGSKDIYCPMDKTAGVPAGADLLIYVTIDKHCAGSSGFSSTLASAIACERDQFDRPISGTVDFCLRGMNGVSPVDSDALINENLNSTQELSTSTMRKNMGDPSNTVMNAKNEGVVKRVVSIAMHEFIHVLGMTSDSFSYFRHPITGKPLTPRPFSVSHVKCVDGREGGYLGLPSESVMKESYGPSGARHYEIVTPTVKQVVRNQFNCQELSGARLENQPTSEDCFGSHWDERLFFTEAMGAVHSSTSNILSPLTLALLEDSGWYRANYESEYIAISSFGHGAGCDFVNEPCLENGEVPLHSKDSFCNSPMDLDETGKVINQSPQTCNPEHTHKAFCDLADVSNRSDSPPVPEVFQYFSDNPNMSPIYFNRADYCPIPFVSPSSCLIDQVPSIEGETYGPNSRCYNTNQEFSMCLDTQCNSDLNKLQVIFQNTMITCDFDGQKHHISVLTSNNDEDIFFECPRFSVVCPELICPSNCAGRGICTFSDQMNNSSSCSCFDPEDKTEGCYDSSIISYALSEGYDNRLASGKNSLNDVQSIMMLSAFIISLSLLFCYSKYRTAKLESQNIVT